MASLVKRGDVWWLDQYVGTGRPRIRRRLGRDKADAERVVAVLNSAQAEARASTSFDLPELLIEIAHSMQRDTPRLETLVSDFLDARRGALSEATIEWYGRYVARFATAFRADPLATVTLARVNRWLSSQTARSNIVRSLKSFGTYLEEEGIWPHNPLRRLKARRTARRVTILSDDQVRAADAALAGTAMLGPFRAGLYAGLRADEICHARLERYDREGAVLVIGPWGDWKTKNLKTRSVPIHARLAKLIRDGKSGWMFLAPRGGPWNRHHLYRQMKEVAGCGLHILRHTFVSRLLAAGVGSSVARDLAGHSTIAVTDGYAHTNLDALRAAIQRL